MSRGGGQNNRFLASGKIASKEFGIGMVSHGVAVGLFSFLLAFVASSIFSPAKTGSAIDCTNGLTPSGAICSADSTDINVGITGAWTVSVSSSGTLGVNITPQGSGVTSTVTDNVNIYTNTPGGYQLYLNATSGSTDIYNNSDTQKELNHFTSTTGTKSSPATLTNNTWGYSLASSPTTFSKVETSSSTSDSLISSGSKTTGSGDDIDVTYGFNANTKLTPGTYTTEVTYTAIAEVPNYTIQSVSPSALTLDQASTNITIITTTPASELALGDVSAKIKNTTLGIDLSLTNCTETTTEVSGASYRAATCTYPGGTVEQGGLPVGTYNIELTSTWHSATYTKTNAITVTSGYTITSNTPTEARNDQATTVTMVTNAPTNNSTAFGTVTGKIGTTNLSNCSATTSGNYRAVQCTIPSGVTVGAYSLSFTASAHSSTTYTKANAMTIRYEYMQEFTSAECTGLGTNGSKTLTDNRGAKKNYRATRLADSNCWMTQNLALDGGITITPSDSNVTSNVALPATASSGESNRTSIQIWAQQSGYDGNYYNWCAAIASASNCATTTEPTTSICPKGWRLPSNSGNPSYQNLFDGRVANYSQAEAAPYSFTRAGGYSNGYFGQGVGRYWSRTPNDSNSAYDFFYADSSFYPQLDNGKYYGFSVRCVFGS